MYKKPVKKPLTDAERVRLDEITFCKFISQLFSVYSNPAKVYDFVEAVCLLGKCDLVLINSVVTICMTQDRRYKILRDEHIHLLAKSNMTVRKILKYLDISQRDYYKVLDKPQPETAPKFTPKQYIEIIKFLNCLSTLIPERIG